MNKQITFAALMAVLMSVVCPMMGWAQEEITVYEVEYSLKNGEATVTGCDREKQGELVIPASVTYEGVEYPVTRIGDYAFYFCNNLTSVVIPEGVTSIGGYAFGECIGLTSVVIPEGVTSIGYAAFLECYGLTSVVIPASVTSIRNGAFCSCSGLTSIVIPEGVTSIESETFVGCSGLTSIVIPKSVTSIEIFAFSGCSGLTSVVIPEGVTSIGGAAFRECSGLTSVVIPASVTSIGDDAFKNCSSLTSVVIPASVTSIGGAVFAYCSSLTAIDVSPDNMNYISSDGVLYTKDKSKLCAFPNGKKVTSVVIPSSVTSIEGGAFMGCSGLTSVVIPTSVTSIEWGAFIDCSNLTSIVIPASVTSIGNGAFYGCSGLTSVVIPEGVTSIGMYVFDGCDSLKAIYSKSVTPPSADSFYEGEEFNAVVYVPVGSKAAYEAAEGWEELIIQEFDFADVASPSIVLPFTAYATSGGVVLSAVEGEAEVAVYNLQGVALYRGTVSGGETVVALPSGSYVVRAGNGKGTLVIVL